MIRLLSLLSATAFLSLAATAGIAAPVTLDPSPDTQARGIVNVVFADYLRERVGIEVQTAAIDVDNDGTGEVIARFVHTGSCNADMSRCRTVLLRYSGRSWKIELDRPAAVVDFEPHHRRIPGPIKLDEVVWEWGSGRYEPSLEDAGTSVSFDNVPEESLASYAATFGEGAKTLAQPKWGTRLRYSTTPLSEATDTVVIKMEGDLACGELTGCPIRVLARNEDTWSTVLASSTTGNIQIADTVRGGFKDLVLRTDRGFVVMGWNGSRYAVADRIEAIRGDD